MPLTPYIVEGVVRKGPKEGYVEIDSTVGVGGSTINVYLSDGVELATNQTVTLTHSSGTLTGITDSNGQYNLDLANLSSYSEGDAFTLKIDTRSTNNEDYPFPIKQVLQLFGNLNVMENCDTSWTITRSDGQPDIEKVTLPDESQYQRTFSYNSDSYLISRSRWVKI